MNSRTNGGAMLAAAAAQFVGTPFKLYGRDPTIGLDCVGLVSASLKEIGIEAHAPTGYRLRNSDPEQWIHYAEHSDLAKVLGRVKTGDIILLKPGPGQQHLIIAEDHRTAIHAHAGLGRVVRQPLTILDQPLAHWRLAQNQTRESPWLHSY